MVAPQTTAGERKVIGWFFGAFFAIAIVYLAFAWISRERECDAACSLSGLEGHVVFTGGNRLELGSRCACTSATGESSEAR